MIHTHFNVEGKGHGSFSKKLISPNNGTKGLPLNFPDTYSFNLKLREGLANSQKLLEKLRKRCNLATNLPRLCCSHLYDNH